jgi:hypothetical protein
MDVLVLQMVYKSNYCSRGDSVAAAPASLLIGVPASLTMVATIRLAAR